VGSTAEQIQRAWILQDRCHLHARRGQHCQYLIPGVCGHGRFCTCNFVVFAHKLGLGAQHPSQINIILELWLEQNCHCCIGTDNILALRKSGCCVNYR
jgi:hypothetical protein